MAALAFLDTETTGLDPTRHEVWEVGMVLRTEDGDETEYLWQLPVDAGKADTMGLTIGRFYERRWPESVGVENHRVARTGKWAPGEGGLARCRLSWNDMEDWAGLFAGITWGAHVVGAVPSFDAAFLGPLLRRHGACPGWHYHLVDVEAMAAGALQEPPPWDSEDLSEQVGCPVDKFDRHTALGDARWAMAVYDAVVNAPMEAG